MKKFIDLTKEELVHEVILSAAVSAGATLLSRPIVYGAEKGFEFIKSKVSKKKHNCGFGKNHTVDNVECTVEE